MQVNANSYTQPTYSTNQATDTKAARNDYLSGLRQKFPGVNIVVRDFSSAAEEKKYAMGCSGSNVAISSEFVDKLVSDPAAAEKFEKELGDAMGNLEKANAQLKSEGIDVFASGSIVRKDGSMNFWGFGRKTVDSPNKPSASQSMSDTLKAIDEKRAKEKEEAKAEEEKALKKAQEKKAQDKKAEKIQMVSAESVDKLAQNMKAAHGDSKPFSGSGIDVKA